MDRPGVPLQASGLEPDNPPPTALQPYVRERASGG
ncbi:hypothetical protein AGR1B_pb0014 [Agrobacterium fabacearum S56]|nr:hypothetical protein AGR1B_pb0014 [Agrobacterium fabacearum S56]